MKKILFTLLIVAFSASVYAVNSNDNNQDLQQLAQLQNANTQQNQASTSGQNQATQTTAEQPQLSPQQLIDEAAFRQMKSSQLPMTPNQIMRLKKDYSQTQYAAAAAPTTPPSPTATSQIVSLAPGTIPPVIRLARGFVSSLVFLDSTGAAWPITAYDLGNPGAFNIQWDRKSNTLMVQATKLYTYGNLAVTLKDLSTPVMLTLIPGQTAVDYRVDLRIQGLGPNAKDLPTGEGMPSGTSPILLSVLEGVPPPGSHTLSVTGGAAQAWLSGDKIYLRTRLVVLSPSWLGTMTSADGMRAYSMPKTPLILVSLGGQVKQLKIEGL